jgi:EAL domain-containing protein (putative c-di-GMP-specific phosphodiesterase class I)
VQAFTQSARVRADEIELEITESMLLNHLDQVVEKMRLLNSMGFCVALDDFGTGYSSLSYLRSLPLHKLKIDQAFVRDIGSDNNDRVIVETIISMAKHMELDVIAEGVEEEYQLNFLREKGCLQYQGYYFAKPVPADVFYDNWLNGAANENE